MALQRPMGGDPASHPAGAAAPYPLREEGRTRSGEGPRGGPLAIVCGTDLSKRSRAAVTAAAAIAGAMREPLWVVHVVDGSVPLLDAPAREKLLAAARERLDAEPAPRSEETRLNSSHVRIS